MNARKQQVLHDLKRIAQIQSDLTLALDDMYRSVIKMLVQKDKEDDEK